jgi:hypothetical protein
MVTDYVENLEKKKYILEKILITSAAVGSGIAQSPQRLAAIWTFWV